MTDKRIVVLGLLVALAAGCAQQCVILRSEYFDITGSVIPAKAADAPIDVLAGKPERPYREIGYVKVAAACGTPQETIDTEMIKRARLAGADAIIDVQHGEDTSEKIVFCGKVLSTRKNIGAGGKAVLYTDKP